jgi:hypothetical protein
MEPLARVPRSREYYLVIKGMDFKVIETLCASRVEKWIRAVKKEFLDTAPIKCVGLDCEFTSPHKGRHNQRTAILKLSVASEVLVFQIYQANDVPQLLKEFLKENTIRFCGPAIQNDTRMLRYYRIEILCAYD